MIRYQILEGDTTTAGGVVQRHTGSGQTLIWHNRLASNLGDKVNCSACGSVGYIAPKGMRRPVDNMKQAPALNGDLCICKCNPPPELKNSQTTFTQNVSGGIVINIPINPLTFNIPNTQQNLNNSLVDDKDQGNSYYKWWWGKLESTKPKTIRQETNSFLRNFSDLHDEYAFGKVYKIYEIDPKAWDGEVAFDDVFPNGIQQSVDGSGDLGKALARLADGQSTNITWKNVGVGGDYFKTIRSKQWPHGRWACTVTGTLTRFGKDENGRYDFQFKGYAKIEKDYYSWEEDNEGVKNKGIKLLGDAIELAAGKKTASPTYGNSKPYGLPTICMRKYHFDYYKKGVKKPNY